MKILNWFKGKEALVGYIVVPVLGIIIWVFIYNLVF